MTALARQEWNTALIRARGGLADVPLYMIPASVLEATLARLEAHATKARANRQKDTAWWWQVAATLVTAELQRRAASMERELEVAAARRRRAGLVGVA